MDYNIIGEVDAELLENCKKMMSAHAFSCLPKVSLAEWMDIANNIYKELTRFIFQDPEILYLTSAQISERLIAEIDAYPFIKKYASMKRLSEYDDFTNSISLRDTNKPHSRDELYYVLLPNRYTMEVSDEEQ